ncbi:MAG TPA: acyltransferase [Solirubrobacteraceae bacterium]|nr:acyltransferase [Solirubrobacteraceae bacterium]
MAVLRQPRFPLLDSVRAIAALSVLVFHASFWSNITLTGSWVAPFLSRLDVGVAIFFVLSGFLLYRPFVRSHLNGTPAPRAGAYGWRRALRILPAYWLALTVIAIVIPKPDTFEAGHAVVYYGFGQIYGDLVFGGISQAWTLCVEVTFYALLPLWALAMRRLPGTVRSELWGLVALGAIGVAWMLVAVLGASDPDHANTSRMLVWLPAYLDHFALGMALAVLSVGEWPRALEWIGRRPWVAWLVAAGAFVLVAVGIGLSPENRLDAPMSAAQTLGRHWLYAVVAVGVLLPAVVGPAREGTVRGLLSRRWLLYLGVISYGIYLWHNNAMEKIAPEIGRDGTWGDFVVYLLVGVVVAVVAASLSWLIVEKPILRLKRLVPDRAQPLRDPESHAPIEPAAVR